ncbi:MAG: hypothetical protein QGH45_05040 [Myxococcota bacterium]|nr:hypothetical protein [Myxococcota bacterium]
MNNPGQERFSAAQLSLLPGLLDRAEEVVGDRFAVASFRDGPYAYDVFSLADLRHDEVPSGTALATLIRYGSDRATRKTSRFHRICLHDGRILTCCRAEGLAVDAVLLVVLVHELIHLVRFTVPHATFHAPVDQRHDEEAEVDRLTARLLRRYPDPRVVAAVATVTGVSLPGPV